MPALYRSTTELSPFEKSRIDDLLRGTGIECVGINDDGFVLFTSVDTVPADRRDTLAQEAMRTLQGDESLKDLVNRTKGVSFIN